MRLSLRRAAVAILALTLCASIAWPAHADPIDDDGNGGFRGTHTFNDNRKGTKKGPAKDTKRPSPKTNRTNDDRGSAPDPCATDAGCASMTAGLDPAAAEQYVRQLIVQLQLPTPTPQFGPDPSVNEWNMLAVGFPIWLWTEGPTTVTASESAFGHTFTLRATYRSTTFTMGDGHAKQCTKTTPYRRSVTPGAKSPTCGYTYQQAAPKGSYTVTATTHWDVAWSVAGYSGTLPGTHSASRDLPIGELHAIRIK